MAISNKNILITPNTSGIFGNQPNVVFTGADSSIGDSAAITLTANPQNTGSLNFSASEGQLFSISNNLTDGDIFTVNDVSGIPSLAIDASGIIKIAEYAKNRPGLFEFLFSAPKAIKLEHQPWKDYQHRLYGVIQGLIEDGVKEGEFPNIDSKLMFKALGGLFMGLVFMGDRNETVSDKEVEALLNKLITDPTLVN